MSTQAIPDGFHTVTPYLIHQDAEAAIAFYKSAFGATEKLVLPGPRGAGVGHAELFIGNSIIMLASEFPAMGCHAPKHYGGCSVGFTIYTGDADTAFNQAVEAGATVDQPLEDKFYGERAGTVVDPFGYKWTFMTHIEDVSDEEMQRRLKEVYAKMESGAS